MIHTNSKMSNPSLYIFKTDQGKEHLVMQASSKAVNFQTNVQKVAKFRKSQASWWPFPEIRQKEQMWFLHCSFEPQFTGIGRVGARRWSSGSSQRKMDFALFMLNRFCIMSCIWLWKVERRKQHHEPSTFIKLSYYAVSKKTVEPVEFNSVCHHLTYWLKQKQIEEMTHNS